jgi:hypothetical protein
VGEESCSPYGGWEKERERGKEEEKRERERQRQREQTRTRCTLLGLAPIDLFLLTRAGFPYSVKPPNSAAEDQVFNT